MKGIVRLQVRGGAGRRVFVVVVVVLVGVVVVVSVVDGPFNGPFNGPVDGPVVVVVVVAFDSPVVWYLSLEVAAPPCGVCWFSSRGAVV